MKIRKESLKDDSIIPLNFDFAFSSIFNNRKNIDILENFLSIYLGIPLERIQGKVELQSRNLPLENKRVKSKQIDLVVDIEGKKINIELSNHITNQGIIDRNIVYACSIHARQLKYDDNKYQDIQKTIQINLNNFKCNNGKIKETYYIQTDSGKKLSEKFQIDVIDMEIGKKKCYTNNERNLARWCCVLTSKNRKELKEALGDDLMTKESRDKLIDEINNISRDDDVIALYSAYTKEELERNSILYEETEKAREKGLKEGREEGFKQGIEQGIEQGVLQGEKNKIIEITNTLLNRNMSIEEISEIVRISKEELLKIIHIN